MPEKSGKYAPEESIKGGKLVETKTPACNKCQLL